jgi:hypothetical protein
MHDHLIETQKAQALEEKQNREAISNGKKE